MQYQFEKILEAKDQMIFDEDMIQNKIKQNEFFEWIEMIADHTIAYKKDGDILKILKMKYKEVDVDITARVWVYKILFSLAENLKVTGPSRMNMKILKIVEGIIT